MKHFNEHRRRLINRRFLRGTRATASCDGSELPLPSTSGSGFETIEIKGNTVQDGVPSSSSPILFQNTGDNGLEIEVSEKNKFDVHTKSSYSESWTYNGGGQHSCPLNLEVGKEYTISWEQQFFWSDVYSGQANLALVRKDSQADTNRESLQYLSSKTILGKSSYTFVADGREMLWTYASGFNMTNASLITALFSMVDNIQIELGDTATEYEPYIEPQVITSPISLAGIGENRDSLIINSISKTISIKKKIAIVKVSDLINNNVWFSEINDTYTANIAGTGNEPTWEVGTQAFCTHCPVYENGVTDGALSFELSRIGAYTDVVFYNLAQSTKEDFITWITDNNVQIAYVMENETIKDATNEARELFDLTTPYNRDATLEVYSAGGIKATYYSLENEDKLSLTVHCVDEENNSLRESEAYLIRKDSLYSLASPIIDGYEPIKTQYEGYLTENTEINITYKEK